MTFKTFSIGALIVITMGIPAAYVAGFKNGNFQAALEENKVASVCLRSNDLLLAPEFREYLKGRIYYNIASKFPNKRGYLLRRDWDFGPVDLSRLNRRIYAKDPNFDSESFNGATRHLTRAESNDEKAEKAYHGNSRSN